MELQIQAHRMGLETPVYREKPATRINGQDKWRCLLQVGPYNVEGLGPKKRDARVDAGQKM